MNPDSPNFRALPDWLKRVADDDVAGLIKAQESYGDSWRSRGGVGAFMMLARKWDRLENWVEQTLLKQGEDHGTVEGSEAYVRANAYDIFSHVIADERSEGIIDDIRDLRRYLMLVEAHLRSEGVAAAMSKHRDNS